MSGRDTPNRTGRRRFLHTIAIASALAAVEPAQALAQAKRAARKPASKPRPVPAPPLSGETPPSEEARALAALLAKRYPHLDPAKVAGITKELDQRLDGGRKLRAVKLPNGAEPDTTFRA